MTIIVHGDPAPQGSKKFVGVTKSGKGLLVESSKNVKPWRERISWAALEVLGKTGSFLGTEFTQPFKGPVSCRIIFTMKKPKTCKKSRKYPDGSPDVDKLARAVFDSLTQAGVWEDDGRVVRLEALKVFPDSHEHALNVPGAVIFVESEL